MTIKEIKYRTLEKSPYFFSRDTLKFFGQSMSDFRVKTSSKGNIYIYAPSYWGEKLMGYTFRKLEDDDLIQCPRCESEAEVLKYIEEN